MTLPKDLARREEYLRRLSESHRGQVPWNKGKKGSQVPWNKGSKTTIPVVCEGCNKEFEVSPSRGDKARFCSQVCYHTYRSGIPPKHELEELYMKLNGPKIALKYGVGTGTVYGWMNKYGIPRRSLSDIQKGDNNSMHGKIPWNKCKKGQQVAWNRGMYPKDWMSQEAYEKWVKEKSSDKHVRNVLKAVNARPNKSELRLLSILKRINPNWRYVGDGSLIIDGKCPDFWDGDGRLVELYGDYWHKNDDPQERIDFFKEHGYDCTVVWESELKDGGGILGEVQAQQGA